MAFAWVSAQLAAFNQNPAGPAKDGLYRLYTAITLKYACCEDRLEVISVGSDKDGGHEFGLLWGSISLVPPQVYTSPTSLTGQLVWMGFGSPHELAEPGFQWVKSRSSINIWHMPVITFGCKQDGTKANPSVGGMSNSRFPSHRVWIDGALKTTKFQGRLSDLWTPSPTWGPTFVSE